MRHPYLIQRCTIQEWKPSYKVSEYLKLDYMGASEFEWGAVPKCLRAFGEKQKQLEVFDIFHAKTLDLPEGASPAVYILCTKDEVKEYTKLLTQLAAQAKDKGGYTPLKEQISLFNMVRGANKERWRGDNFWFDIDNAVAICLSKEPLENFKLAVVNSINFMDAQKDK